MLYPTLNQPIVCVMMLLVGVFAGLTFDLVRILTLLSGKDNVSKHIIEFCATVFSLVLFFFTNLHYNFGQLRFYVILVFLVGFTLERIIARFLWTKLLKKWYSIIAQRRKQVGKRKKEKVD